MKKTIVILTILSFAISAILLLSGCESSKELEDTNSVNDTESNPFANETKEYDDIDLDDYQRVEILFDHYSMREIIEMRYHDYGDFCEDVGIPNMYLILEELESQGYYDEIDNLRTMVEKIGYWPSAIFGNYVADGRHIIHKTNGPCFEEIDSSELMSLGPLVTLREVKDEVEDGDSYLEDFSICAICCGK